MKTLSAGPFSTYQSSRAVTPQIKKYLHCVILKKDGSTFENPLKLSEAHLISKMAQDHKSVTVSIKEVGESAYKAIIG